MQLEKQLLPKDFQNVYQEFTIKLHEKKLKKKGIILIDQIFRFRKDSISIQEPLKKMLWKFQSFWKHENILSVIGL